MVVMEFNELGYWLCESIGISKTSSEEQQRVLREMTVIVIKY